MATKEKARTIAEIKEAAKPNLRVLANDDLPRDLTVTSLPDGMEGEALAQLARSSDRPVLFVARDGNRQASAENSLRFFDPEITVLRLPGWDCMPYDRASPSSLVQARRTARTGRRW